MLSGFNTNIRYRGVLFHVQTEDSGRDNPHIITHLFYGGNIMASEKSEYRDVLEAEADGANPNVEGEVRARMESQHKAMLKRLTRAEYDAGIEARLGADAWQDAAADSAATLPPDAPQTPAPAGEPAEASSLEGGNAKEELARAFGDGVVTQKPLDEVVLDFLVENARKRKRSARSK